MGNWTAASSTTNIFKPWLGAPAGLNKQKQLRCFNGRSEALGMHTRHFNPSYWPTRFPTPVLAGAHTWQRFGLQRRSDSPSDFLFQKMLKGLDNYIISSLCNLQWFIHLASSGAVLWDSNMSIFGTCLKSRKLFQTGPSIFNLVALF